MSLFAAAYVSTPTAGFSDRDLSTLMLSARHFNGIHQITGKLVVAEAPGEDGTPRAVRFVQWIEGEPDDVRACLRRIYADPRHDDLQIQFFGPVPARRFPAWDMALETVPTDTVDHARSALVPDAHPVDLDSLEL